MYFAKQKHNAKPKKKIGTKIVSGKKTDQVFYEQKRFDKLCAKGADSNLIITARSTAQVLKKNYEKQQCRQTEKKNLNT